MACTTKPFRDRQLLIRTCQALTVVLEFAHRGVHMEGLGMFAKYGDEVIGDWLHPLARRNEGGEIRHACIRADDYLCQRRTAFSYMQLVVTAAMALSLITCMH